MASGYCRPCWIEHNPTQLSGRYWRVAPNTAEYTSSRSSADASTRSYANGGNAFLKSGRYQIRRHHIAAEVLHLVLLGQKDLPLQQIDGNIHPGERKLRAAFFRKGSPRMQEHKRNFVSASGAEASPQQGHAISIWSLYWLDLLSTNIGRQNACSGRERHLQKRLSLVLDGEFYFGERPAFRSHERCNHRTFCNGRKHAAVWKSRPLQR